MSNKKTPLCDSLFNDGRKPVGFDEFIGRYDLQQIFLDYAWKKKTARDYVFVIEGATGFGKSSFANWCSDKVKTDAPNGEVILTSIDRWGKAVGLESPADFYHYLSGKFMESISQSVLQKSEPTNVITARMRGLLWWAKKIWQRARQRYSLKEVGYGLAKIGVSDRGSLPNSTRFFQFIEQTHGKAKKHLDIKSYVFIFDNITLSERNVFEEIINLLMDLFDYSKWADDFPNVMLILLPLPGAFGEDVSYGKETVGSAGVSRRFTKTGELRLFTQTEIGQYLDKKIASTSAKIEKNSFIPALHFMSGGIPRLTNLLGHMACEIYEKSNSKSLNANHIFEAETHVQTKGKFAEAVKQVVRDAYDLKTEKLLETKSDILVYNSFYTAQPINYGNIDYASNFIKKGLTKSEWKDKILGKVGKGASENHDSFEKIWDELESKEILVENNSRYKFCAEVIRKYCGTVKPK